MGSPCLLADGEARFSTLPAKSFKVTISSLTQLKLMQHTLSTDLEWRIKQQLIMIQHSLLRARSLPTPPMEQVSAQDKFICEFCEREFSNSPSLDSHMDSHINSDPEVPFRCDVCGKCFSVPAKLTKHYETHKEEHRNDSQERPYQCSVCNRSFEHSGKLHRHMRIHTGERPHQCHLCNKTFIQSGQLVIHMRTHTGEKPYVCNTCEKGFTCSKQLKVHMRTHTGEKPYSCDICGKSFGYNHVLKLHQMAHFGEKVYKCTICKSTFGNKKSLEAHIKTHNESMVESPRSVSSSIRSGSAGSPAHSISSSSEREISIFRSSLSPIIRSPVSTPLHFNAPLAHSSMISQAITRNPIDSEFILPSINTICPGEASSIDTFSAKTSNLNRLSAPRISPIRKNPLYPVTPTLVKALLEEDLAAYGPPTPLRTPPLSPAIYGGCLITPLAPEPSFTPPPSVSPPTSISMMTESSLPLRKRRMALSECSDSEDLSCKQERPGSTDLSGSRGSVICFANRG